MITVHSRMKTAGVRRARLGNLSAVQIRRTFRRRGARTAPTFRSAAWRVWVCSDPLHAEGVIRSHSSLSLLRPWGSEVAGGSHPGAHSSPLLQLIGCESKPWLDFGRERSERQHLTLVPVPGHPPRRRPRYKMAGSGRCDPRQQGFGGGS